MAIINNNVQNVSFLRNQTLFETRELAIAALQTHKSEANDGTALLARYKEEGDTEVTTLVGYVFVSGETRDVTIFDLEGADAKVDALRTEIIGLLGDSFITSGNTVEANLTALSGNNQSTSAETSVEGAKKYADAKIDEAIAGLNYTGVTTGDGVYVTNVTEVDGTVSATTATLPTVDDTAVDLNFVTAVDQTNGQIAISRGEITSSNKTISLSANTDGGVDFKANVDGTTIIINQETGVMSVASSALVQYEGDGKTVQISAVQNGVRTVSSPLTISSTTVTDTNVKEQFNLVNASGETVGATIKIYKDSSLYSAYLGHVDDTITSADDPTVVSGTGDAALCFIYHKEDGSYELVPVNVETFLEETEFESGVTATNHIVHGVVDSASEKDSQDTPVDFLTVGADGFKISGIKDEIDRKINALDATGGTQTIATDKHVAVEVVEANGLITAVTVTEDNIADADDLAALSAKTVTEVASSNSSVSATSSATADGTVKYDIVTDADKIKMSGFSSNEGALSGITEADSIATAFEKVDAVITENEQVTSAALNDLDARIKELSGGSASDLADEIAARKAVDGINGDAYSANTSANYISAATSLNDADQKLDAAIKVVEGDLDVVEGKYLSGVSVNGSATTVNNHVAGFNITSATGATTAATSNAIIVQTDANGNITLGLNNIDAGFYDGSE